MDGAGQVAIVTGAGGGMGRITAKALVEIGMHVCVADQNPDRADSVLDEYQYVQFEPEAFSWQVDVSNKFQVSAMIEETRDRYGRLDYLIHNAHVKPRGEILTLDEWGWRRTVEVNVTGAFYCGQLAARVMADEGGGTIVFLVHREKLEHSTVFRTTQGAVMSFAERLAKEVEPMGVLVRTVMVYPPDHETLEQILAACGIADAT